MWAWLEQLRPPRKTLFTCAMHKASCASCTNQTMSSSSRCLAVRNTQLALLVLALLQSSLAVENFYELTALDATGAEVSLQQYKGKVTKAKCLILEYPPQSLY